MSKLDKGILAIQHNLALWVKKDQRMSQGRGYDYFNETSIFNVLKPQLKAHGIGYLISAEGAPTIVKDGSMYQFTSAGTLLLFNDEGDQRLLPIVLTAMNTDPAKAMGSALTYATKYWLAKLFGLPTDELDPDTTENTEKVSKKDAKEARTPGASKQAFTPKPKFKSLDEQEQERLIGEIKAKVASNPAFEAEIKKTTQAFKKSVSQLSTDQLMALLAKAGS